MDRLTILINELREDARGGFAYHDLSERAADEIERLRSAMRKMLEFDMEFAESWQFRDFIRDILEEK